MKIVTFFTGKYIGQDAFGNCYYEGHSPTRYNKKRRWVIFKGEVEASKITPQWFNWMHYQSDRIPNSNTNKYNWEKPYLPNLTGTKYAYHPPGHVLSKKAKRHSATGDYERWQP
jgi:NADH:ubiquinone oxidoreductase subunit